MGLGSAFLGAPEERPQGGDVTPACGRPGVVAPVELVPPVSAKERKLEDGFAAVLGEPTRIVSSSMSPVAVPGFAADQAHKNKMAKDVGR